MTKKRDLIFQLLQLTVQHPPIFRTPHMLNRPANLPGLQFQAFDLQDDFGFGIINCAHRQASMCATTTKFYHRWNVQGNQNTEN
jgi:hypothetical protein